NLKHVIKIGIMANTGGTSRKNSGHARRRISWLYRFFVWDNNSTEYSISLTLLYRIATTAMYSQTCRFFSSLEYYLIIISSFCQTPLIQVIGIQSHLIKRRNYLTIIILTSVTILHSHDLHEMRTQIRNHKDMRVTIKWIFRCIFLHTLLEVMEDEWNEQYEEEEPNSAPMVLDDVDSSNNGIHGILCPINLTHFE
ncbi:hypothetical protein VP01_1234g5, partial [Puccinia sorghi]